MKTISSKKMKKDGYVVKVKEWIQVKGAFWEYYVLEEWNADGVALCLVDGDEQEIGYVSLPEIKPHVNFRVPASEFGGLQPAPGWAWV